jgi:hypothetical protein
MTRNETHVHDLSTLANFKDWAQSINAALTAFGWTQSSDTGQVNWGSIASVPTSNNYVYEIWQPGDGGTNFFVRIDYGNNGGSSPALKIQAGTTTNGAGTLTGFTSQQSVPSTTNNSGATLYNCLYCGDSSSFAIMLWRDIANGNCAIGVDRSRSSSGAVTNSYFTVFCARDSNHTNSPYAQRSIVFGVGAGPLSAGNGETLFNAITGAAFMDGSTQSLNFNGNIGITPVFPFVGYYDNPTLLFIHPAQNDFTELALINTTLLGASHTFIFSKNNNFNAAHGYGLAMRWE